MRRCQEWPRGYAGDFETIEYLVAGTNHSEPGTLGWHLEEILLHSAVVEQHRNKLRLQSLEIGGAVDRNKAARVLSVACGGCLDWLPVLPSLEGFAGEIVLNDCEPAALELAERRLRLATTRYRLAAGNVLRVAKRLAHGPRFDLVIAGGLFDYLPDHAIAYLLGVISEDLLAPGGVLLFTNIAVGNPLRPLMEHGANWSLIERSEDQMHRLCAQAGIARSSVSMTREATGLTLITRIVQPDSRLAIPDFLAGTLQIRQSIPA
jgi:SAM-dependent methyltransferase